MVIVDISLMRLEYLLLANLAMTALAAYLAYRVLKVVSQTKRRKS